MTSSCTPQQYNLRWNSHLNNILLMFSEQLTNESMVDVTISCQGQFLKAHKMILSACSPYFQELFQMHQVAHPVIIINGMSFLDIKLVIEFMYRGEVKVQEADLGGLLLAAETLQVKGLANVRNKYEKGQISEKSSIGSTPHGQDSLTQPRKSEQSMEEEQSISEFQTQSLSSESTEQEFDDDLPATIKVEPPEIRDIDEEEPNSGWDSPRLVIDMKESKEAMTERLEAIERKRPNILRAPSQAIRVAAAHIEMSEGEGSSTKKDIPEVSSSAKCYVWPKRSSKVFGTWGRAKLCKIPRPPNAFMIFANDWRRKLAGEFPVESNKDISVRLGTMWKNLDADSKETYYSAARKADEDHKLKYPGYYYSPKEARIRKGLKQRRVIQGDALRFVKVFMTSAEKNSAGNKNSTSLLRRLPSEESSDKKSEENKSNQLEIKDAEMNENISIQTKETPIDVESI